MQIATLYNLSENDRIEMIGHRVLGHKEVVGFIVEDNEKADRYMRKIRQKFGTRVVEIDRNPGPVEGVITVRVREASQGNA